MSNQRNYTYQGNGQRSWFEAVQRLLMCWHLFSNISQILPYIRSWRLQEQQQDSAIFTVPLLCQNQIAQRTLMNFFFIKVCILEIISLKSLFRVVLFTHLIVYQV